MFGSQQDPSRTEEATPKRKQKQRQEGNVPKSQELGKTVSLVAGLIILYLWIGPMSEEIKRIFERFHRVDPSRSDRTGGSGLGLAIVRGIVHLPRLLFYS